MTSPQDDWERWRATWREGGRAPPALAVLRQQVQREQRRIAFTAVAEVVVALAAASGIAAALVHTPSGHPAAWGATVLVLIAIAFTSAVILLRRGGQWLPLTQSTQTFVDLSLVRCRRQLRAVRLTWILIALELVFLVPWWAGGLRSHGEAWLSPLFVLSAWLPMSLIAALFAWSLLFWRRLISEMGLLENLRKKLREG